MSKKRQRKKQERSRRAKPGRASAGASKRGPDLELLEAATAKAREDAGEFLRRDDLAARVVQLADGTRELALRVMRQSPLEGKHECRAGCGFCCHTAITVAAPEAFAMAAYLREHLSQEELAEVRRRLDENAALASSMSRQEYITRLPTCALLTADDNCRVHPVRPIACAGFLSTSRSKCEAEYNRVPGRDPVPSDKFAMLAGLAVSNGLMEACKRAKLDGEFYELNHALRRVLDTPDAADRWARGEDVFSGCLK
ncbi:MAG TPA: YkgJ family cysteine cluster protein [Phycisphaerae bacterium]|nr:YkgJ family cysteine cluster protein [Phycisphaerae bacterium]